MKKIHKPYTTKGVSCPCHKPGNLLVGSGCQKIHVKVPQETELVKFSWVKGAFPDLGAVD